jgi:hypothetical protein
VREAEEAFRGGRLEEAGRLLRDRDVCEFLPAKRRLEKVAGEMAQRAQRRATTGQTMDGWRDLESAAALGADAALLDRVRQQFIERGLAEAEDYLTAGDPAAAVSRLECLRRQHAGNREVRILSETAQRVLAAQQLCHRGKFAEAQIDLSAAVSLRPDLAALAELRKACRVKAEAAQRLAHTLYEAVSAEDWTRVLAAAEALLEMCPEHSAAIDARRRAWAVAGANLADSTRGGRAERRARPTPSTDELALAMNERNELDSDAGVVPAPRFVLWVDGVGGYLVCQGNEVTLGQPVPGSHVDVPILADVSRRHARIRRDGENYLLHALRPLKVNGRAIDTSTTLTDGAMIELGHGVKVRFRVPHPLSRTARLDFISHHRTQPSTDGVLLLAESCVLGPSATSHVVCPNLSAEVVLFGQGEQLHCRAAGTFQIDGATVEGRGPVGRSSQISGEDFSLSLEAL